MLIDFFDYFSLPTFTVFNPTLKRNYVNYFNSSWVEESDKWVLEVRSNDADITVDEDVITIKYSVSLGDNGKYEYQKTVSFPENSNHETIKAKRDNGRIVISVDKVIVEEKKGRKLVIE